MTYIMAIRIDHRSKKAPEVQEILTKHGCIIKLRVGCHETSPEKCAEDGMIILHISCQNKDEITALEKDLSNLEGVTVKKMDI